MRDEKQKIITSRVELRLINGMAGLTPKWREAHAGFLPNVDMSRKALSEVGDCGKSRFPCG